MSLARLIVFLILFCASAVWAGMVLTVQYVRFENREVLAARHSRNSTIEDLPKMESTLTDYDAILRVIPCSAPLLRERVQLLARASDVAMDNPEAVDADAYLERTQTALLAQISCMPSDGKAWLDLANVNNYSEGFTERSLAAYKMSEQVSPGEAWIAEKRLNFALTFRPLFDAQALALARKDIATLEHGAAFHLNLILRATKLTSTQELYALFAEPPANGTAAPL